MFYYMYSVVFTYFYTSMHNYWYFITVFFADGIGSQQLVTVWLPAWLQQNYGSAVATMKFNGVIVLDTVMNYNNSAHAQIIPGDETAVGVLTYFFK